MGQSAPKRKQKIERLLSAAETSGPETRSKTDAELLMLSGIGPTTVKQIRDLWPANGDAEKPPELPPVAVYDFGLKAASEKQKRGGIWHDMEQIAPDLWGPVQLRLRSSDSQAVVARLDRINHALIAGQPGSEQLLGKVREEVKLDSGDRALSKAVMMAALAIMPSAFGITQQRSRQQSLEYTWRQALAHVRGLRGTARFEGEERIFTGRESEEEIQKLLGELLEMSGEHAQSILSCVTKMRNLEAAEMIRLGETFVVTELRAVVSSVSGATLPIGGRGQ